MCVFDCVMRISVLSMCIFFFQCLTELDSEML